MGKTFFKKIHVNYTVLFITVDAVLYLTKRCQILEFVGRKQLLKHTIITIDTYTYPARRIT